MIRFMLKRDSFNEKIYYRTRAMLEISCQSLFYATFIQSDSPLRTSLTWKHLFNDNFQFLHRLIENPFSIMGQN